MNVESSAPKPHSNASAAHSSTGAASSAGKADRRAAALQAGGFSSFLTQALTSETSEPESLEVTQSDNGEDDGEPLSMNDGKLDNDAEVTDKPAEVAKTSGSGEAKAQAQSDGPKSVDRKDETQRSALVVDPNLLRVQNDAQTTGTTAVETQDTALVESSERTVGLAAATGIGTAAVAGTAQNRSLVTSSVANGPASKSHGLLRSGRPDADTAASARRTALEEKQLADRLPAGSEPIAKDVRSTFGERDEALARERSRRIEPALVADGAPVNLEPSGHAAKSAAPTADFASLLAATQLLPTGNTQGIDLAPGKLALTEVAPTLYEVQGAPGGPGFNDSLASQLGNIITHSRDSAEIQLNPRELGPIRVEVTIKDKETHVVMSASQPMTLAALEQSAPQLRSLLSEQGLNLQQLEISASFSSTDRGAQMQSDSSPRGDSRSPGSDGRPPSEPGTTVERSSAQARASRRLLDLFA